MDGSSIQPTMVGGAKFKLAFLDWVRKSYSLYWTVFITFVLLWVAFADKLPPDVSWALSTTVGRAFLLVVLWCVYKNIGFTAAVLVTIAIAITWTNRPIPIGEGFLDEVKKTTVGNKQHRWFVERVLHENPLGIEEDRVSTQAAQ